MPALPTRTSTATTPNRRTHIRFDVDERVLVEPIFSVERKLRQIQPQDEGTSNVEFIDEIGWQLSLKQSKRSNVNEVGQAVAGSSELTTPSGWAQKNRSVASPLTGVTYASGILAAAQDPFWVRILAAGTSVAAAAYRLSGDETSFPTATSGDEHALMQRVAVGKGELNSDDPTRPHGYIFTIPGVRTSAPDWLTTYYFYGPTGYRSPEKLADGTPRYRHDGNYAAVFSGNGMFYLKVHLYDRQTSTLIWREVKWASYCLGYAVPGRSYGFIVRQSLNPLGRPNCAGIISIKVTEAGSAHQSSDHRQKGIGSGILGVAQSPNQNTTPRTHTLTYFVPKPDIVSPPAPQPVRVDHRQDIQLEWQVDLPRYETSGTLQDKAFHTNFLPYDTSVPFQVWYQAVVPAGCAITWKLYSTRTNAELSGNMPDIDPSTGLGWRFYYIKFTLTGNGTASPTLISYRVYRDGIWDVISPGEFEVPFYEPSPPAVANQFSKGTAEGMMIMGAEMDPAQESAAFMVHDLIDVMPRLASRSEIPVIIETETNITDPNPANRVRIKDFRGYVLNPIEQIIGRADGLAGATGTSLTSAYGKSYKRYPLTAAGMWARLQERVIDFRFDLRDSPYTDSSGTTLPYLATEALELLFNAAGFATPDLDIPPKPIRLFSSDGNDGMVIEPQTNIAELIVRICHEYLGSYVFADPCAGDYGMWRVMEQQVPGNYTIVAAFDTGYPSAVGDFVVPNNINAYPTTAVPAGYANSGSQVPVFPIFWDDSNWQRKRAEGNYVISYAPTADSGGGVAAITSQVLANPVSFNFPGGPNVADPDSVDWIPRPVPIFAYLPLYSGIDWFGGESYALNFITRRIYDVACHGREVRTGTVPKGYITDPNDTIVTGPRPLRFYHAVLVDGEAAIVRNVNPKYTKDDHQLQTIQFERTFLN